jgi:hypothetical protein
MTSLQDTAVPRGARWRSRLRRIPPVAYLQVLAIVPLVVIVDLVRDSSQLPWLDYWGGLARFTDSDGSLRPLDLLFFSESHVPALPNLIYWINLQLTNGLSHPIGYYDIAVVLAQLLVLRFLLPKPEQLGWLWHSLLVVGFAVLLFAPQGAWNFSRAMSGGAWLTANLLTLIAIAFAARGRLIWAVPFAGLASLTYGTGLMAWPAVVLIAALRGRWNWRGWALAGAGAVTLATYAIAYQRPSSHASVGLEFNDLARRMFQVLGAVISPDPELALVAGVVGLGLAAFLVAACLHPLDLRRQALPFIALAAYAVLAAAMIGTARGGLHEANLGVASRYASLSIMLWIAVLALCVIRFRPDPRVWLLGFAVAALAFASGQPTLASMRTAGLAQDELAIALRMGVATGYPYAPRPTDVPRFQAMGHYPFSSDFDDDCGLLGRRIDPGSIDPIGPSEKGNLDRFEASYNPDSVRLVGWFGSALGDTDCVVFTDESLRVIGAASTGHDRQDVAPVGSPTGSLDIGFVGPARAGAEEYRAFAVVDGHQGVYEIPGTLTQEKPAEEP